MYVKFGCKVLYEDNKRLVCMTVRMYVYILKSAGRSTRLRKRGGIGGAAVSKTLLALVLCLFPMLLSAQTTRVKESDTIPGRERWAIKTNAVEWLLTIPNIGVEFDLSRSIYNRMTIGLTAKWNWNTRHNYKPSVVFNVFEVRPEFRYYWRTTMKQPRDDDDTTRRSVRQWLKEEVFTTGRVDPKYWRAYYIGGYVHGGKYSFKFGEEGRQGQMYGLGFTMGYGLPLYTYKSGAIDIELGASLGIELTKYDVYTHNPDGNYYTKVESKSRGLHVVPYPVVSELKVGFVYRFNSIQNKYKRVDYVKQELKRQRREEAQMRRDSILMQRDSARMQRLAEREALRTPRDSSGTVAAPDTAAVKAKWWQVFKKRDKATEQAQPAVKEVSVEPAVKEETVEEAAVEEKKKERTGIKSLFRFGKKRKGGDA